MGKQRGIRKNGLKRPRIAVSPLQPVQDVASTGYGESTEAFKNLQSLLPRQRRCFDKGLRELKKIEKTARNVWSNALLKHAGANRSHMDSLVRDANAKVQKKLETARQVVTKLSKKAQRDERDQMRIEDLRFERLEAIMQEQNTQEMQSNLFQQTAKEQDTQEMQSNLFQQTAKEQNTQMMERNLFQQTEKEQLKQPAKEQQEEQSKEPGVNMIEKEEEAHFGSKDEEHSEKETLTEESQRKSPTQTEQHLFPTEQEQPVGDGADEESRPVERDTLKEDTENSRIEMEKQKKEKELEHEANERKLLGQEEIIAEDLRRLVRSGLSNQALMCEQDLESLFLNKCWREEVLRQEKSLVDMGKEDIDHTTAWQLEDIRAKEHKEAVTMHLEEERRKLEEHAEATLFKESVTLGVFQSLFVHCMERLDENLQARCFIDPVCVSWPTDSFTPTRNLEAYNLEVLVQPLGLEQKLTPTKIDRENIWFSDKASVITFKRPSSEDTNPLVVQFRLVRNTEILGEALYDLYDLQHAASGTRKLKLKLQPHFDSERNWLERKTPYCEHFQKETLPHLLQRLPQVQKDYFTRLQAAERERLQAVFQAKLVDSYNCTLVLHESEPVRSFRAIDISFGGLHRHRIVEPEQRELRFSFLGSRGGRFKSWDVLAVTFTQLSGETCNIFVPCSAILKGSVKIDVCGKAISLSSVWCPASREEQLSILARKEKRQSIADLALKKSKARAMQTFFRSVLAKGQVKRQTALKYGISMEDGWKAYADFRRKQCFYVHPDEKDIIVERRRRSPHVKSLFARLEKERMKRYARLALEGLQAMKAKHGSLSERNSISFAKLCLKLGSGDIASAVEALEAIRAKSRLPPDALRSLAAGYFVLWEKEGVCVHSYLESSAEIWKEILESPTDWVEWGNDAFEKCVSSLLASGELKRAAKALGTYIRFFRDTLKQHDADCFIETYAMMMFQLGKRKAAKREILSLLQIEPGKPAKNLSPLGYLLLSLLYEANWQVSHKAMDLQEFQETKTSMFETILSSSSTFSDMRAHAMGLKKDMDTWWNSPDTWVLFAQAMQGKPTHLLLELVCYHRALALGAVLDHSLTLRLAHSTLLSGDAFGAEYVVQQGLGNFLHQISDMSMDHRDFLTLLSFYETHTRQGFYRARARRSCPKIATMRAEREAKIRRARFHEWRNFQQWSRKVREEAVLVIQHNFRIHRARKLVRLARERKARVEEMHQNVVTRVRQSSISQVFQAWKLHTSTMASVRNLISRRTSGMVQLVFKAWATLQARKRFRKTYNAKTIQRGWRAYWMKKTYEHALVVRRADAAKRAFFQTLLRETVAATRIQRHFRAWRAYQAHLAARQERRRVRNMHATRLQAFFRSRLRSMAFTTAKFSAVKIQAMIRGWSTRKRMKIIFVHHFSETAARFNRPIQRRNPRPMGIASGSSSLQPSSLMFAPKKSLGPLKKKRKNSKKQNKKSRSESFPAFDPDFQDVLLGTPKLQASYVVPLCKPSRHRPMMQKYQLQAPSDNRLETKFVLPKLKCLR